MKKMKNVLIALMVLLLISASGTTAYSLQLEPNLPSLPNVSLPFISKHEVLKAIPVYRVTIGKTGIHNYTSSKSEFDYLLNYQYNDDGILGYISPVPLPGTTPLHLMKKSYEHYIAPSDAARDDVIGKYGYAYNGTLGYGVPLENSSYGDTNVLSWYRGNNGDKSYWNADHYYNIKSSYISSHNYEGPVFRCWSNAAVLQEIDLISPNGGETFTAGDKVDIKWSSKVSGGYIHLYYSTDGGSTWGTIKDAAANNGSYQWTVPNDASAKTIIEAIWDYKGAVCVDQSDNYFTIKANLNIPALQLNTKLDFSKLIAPVAPTSLTTSSNFMKKNPVLYWKDNAKDETGYVVERKNAGGSYSEIAKVGKDATQYYDNTAQAGSTYVYRVKAERDGVYSLYSNEAQGSVFDLPDITVELPGTALPGNTGSGDQGTTDGTNPQVPGNVDMVFTLDKSTYTVNGEIKTMDVSPVVLQGRTVLPVRFAADPLGAETEWNNIDRKVTVTLGSTKLELWIGNNTALVNGVPTPIDPENAEVKPVIMNGRTMLPMRFVTENLGCSVEWIQADRQIKVTFKGNYLDPQPEPPME